MGVVFVEPAGVVVVGVAVVAVVEVVVVVEVVEVVVVATKHTGFVMVLASSVTEPLRASKRPFTVALVSAVIEVRARMVPSKEELDPSVAELVTCQKMLHGFAELINTMLLALLVIKVDGIWKIKTAFGFPCPSRVRVPVKLDVPAGTE